MQNHVCFPRNVTVKNYIAVSSYEIYGTVKDDQDRTHVAKAVVKVNAKQPERPTGALAPPPPSLLIRPPSPRTPAFPSISPVPLPITPPKKPTHYRTTQKDLQISVNKQSYMVGEDCHVTIISPFAPAVGMIAVMTNTGLWHTITFQMETDTQGISDWRFPLIFYSCENSSVGRIYT